MHFGNFVKRILQPDPRAAAGRTHDFSKSVTLDAAFAMMVTASHRQPPKEIE
jgi:hypothetical protein